jgi:intermediate cleaving peptidase 55
LGVQKKIIKKCTEEADVSLNNLQDETLELLREECSRIFKRPVSMSEMERLYPHHVGHWIGLDLHDTETVSRDTKLKVGITLTIEPGLYIPNEPQYPQEFRGIGIRIEDDVAVGKTNLEGPLVLTAEAPKEVEDIEAIMAGKIVNLK